MEEYIGIIKPFAGTFAPRGWQFCDGRKLPIREYEALYTIIGTIYGGDGVKDFAVPDLRSRIPIDQGQSPGLTARAIGEYGGSEESIIDLKTLARHSHTSNALNVAASSDTPEGHFLTVTTTDRYCTKDPADTDILMNNEVISVAEGGSESHYNMPPFLVINYIICCIGIFPSKQ